MNEKVTLQRLVALLRSTDFNNELADLLFETAQELDTVEAWGDWVFAHNLLCEIEEQPK